MGSTLACFTSCSNVLSNGILKIIIKLVNAIFIIMAWFKQCLTRSSLNLAFVALLNYGLALYLNQASGVLYEKSCVIFCQLTFGERTVAQWQNLSFACRRMVLLSIRQCPMLFLSYKAYFNWRIMVFKRELPCSYIKIHLNWCVKLDMHIGYSFKAIYMNYSLIL